MLQLCLGGIFVASTKEGTSVIKGMECQHWRSVNVSAGQCHEPSVTVTFAFWQTSFVCCGLVVVMSKNYGKILALIKPAYIAIIFRNMCGNFVLYGMGFLEAV